MVYRRCGYLSWCAWASMCIDVGVDNVELQYASVGEEEGGV